MKILKINSSGNTYNSVTRHHVDAIVDRLKDKNSSIVVTDRDVVHSNLPFIDAAHLSAMFSKEELTATQLLTLAKSNELVDELLENDVLVIGAPMYNFSVPAALKAYFDLISRAGITFRYTAEGRPEGLVNGKKAYVVISTGGTPIGSPYDFSKGYIQTFLGFLGITDVEFIIADEAGKTAEQKNEIVAEKLAVLN